MAAGLGSIARYCQNYVMAKRQGSKTPAAKRVTAAGIVEAIEQDVELSTEQVKDAAKRAVAAVEKKLGVGKSRARTAGKAVAKNKPAKSKTSKRKKLTR